QHILSHFAVARLGRDTLVALGAEQLRLLAAAAHDVDAIVACDGQDPALDWRRGMVGSEPPVRAQEDFLCCVLGGVDAAEQPPAEAENAPVVVSIVLRKVRLGSHSASRAGSPVVS